jgi:hypothetical protein
MNAVTPFKAGTRIEMHGMDAFPGFPGVAPEHAVIGRWVERINGPRDGKISPANGWHVVKFADGGCLLSHETRFRVIDNRGA